MHIHANLLPGMNRKFVDEVHRVLASENTGDIRLLASAVGDCKPLLLCCTMYMQKFKKKDHRDIVYLLDLCGWNLSYLSIYLLMTTITYT